MKENKRQVGAGYERRAGAFLEKMGCEILEYHYQTRQGEIDLIARDDACLVFCEVKYRKNDSSGHPLEAVDERKQRKISQCARVYLYTHPQTTKTCRFDVVGILGEEITWIRNAFPYKGV